MSEYKYKAFISYSHADEKWARWLHKSLESYRPPKHLVGTSNAMGEIPAKMSPVFRDREELASSTDLGADLTAALEASACQIVICSISAANSHWVNEEILAFKRLGRSKRVFSLIVEGEPYSSGMKGFEEFECFPHALRYQLGDDGEITDTPAEPIAADARPGKDGKSHAKVKLLAGMLGVGFDDLRQRELQRRNRRLAFISGAAVVGMVIAIGLATTAMLARNEAERQRARAEHEAEIANRTAGFMKGLFKVTDPGESRGKTVTAREILVKGAARIETELADQPAMQTDLMNTMGESFIGLGLYDDARGLLEQSLSRRRTIVGLGVEELSTSLYNYANVLTEQAEFDAAEQHYLEAVAELTREKGPEDPATLDNLAGLAELYFRIGQYDKAEPILRQVLAARQHQFGLEDSSVAAAMEELGLNMYDQGKYEGAEVLIRDALELRIKLLGDEPHPDVASNMNSLAMVLEPLGRSEDIERLYEEALAMNRALHGERHPDIALALQNLADMYLDRDELDKAEVMYREALEMQRQLFGESHPEVARALNNLAFVHYYGGNTPAALASMRRSLAISQEVHGGEQHPEIASALSSLGRWLVEAGEYKEAEGILREALAQQENLLEDDQEGMAITRMALANLLTDTGRYEEALEQAAASETSLTNTLGTDHWYTALATNIRGSILGKLGRNDEAETVLQSSYQQLANDEGAVPLFVGRSLKRLIDFYDATNQTDKAQPLRLTYNSDYQE